MKIIIDDKIPFIKGVFEKSGEVRYLPGAKITREDVSEADALIIRTRTKCNEDLLKDSKVKIIASATIGHDHIDKKYCEKAGIEWQNAPGCNSGSVKQYIASALVNYCLKNNLQPENLTIGVVGVGNVGSKTASVAQAMGFQVLLNDPPRAVKGGPGNFISLDEIREKSDIITFHVPLNLEGEYATYHMCDGAFLYKCKPGALIINSSRGEVIDTEAIKKYLTDGKGNAILDVWENEPDIDLELLDKVDIATPHIAGYSVDGKANGTAMSVKAVTDFLHLGIDNWYPDNLPAPENSVIEIKTLGKSKLEILAEAINKTYLISDDDSALRSNPDSFENLRGNYPIRREFGTYAVKLDSSDPDLKSAFRNMGFKTN